jgi:hypothetical protein
MTTTEMVMGWELKMASMQQKWKYIAILAITGQSSS